jgi:hypothetical protein
MQFPYERYKLQEAPLKIYYPADEEKLARWVVSTIEKARTLLTQLLDQEPPELQILLVQAEDWESAPRDEDEEPGTPYPYLTDVTSLPSIVIPGELGALYGQLTQEKLAFIIYHALTLAFLENDARPWPENYPLWADEWQLTFTALWLAQQLDEQRGIVNKDLHEQYIDIFEPEADGKTPVTIRGFDWYEDTAPEDYLTFELLLEQFAADLLAHYDIAVLPRFLAQYRRPHEALLSDEVVAMLGSALGPEGTEWLEALVYF